jgi:putative restriction endonuclease
MIWLEMSRDPLHGGGDWGFSYCLWSPSHKKNGTRWAFWDSLLKVEEGDSVLHLRGKGKEAAFVGTSMASRGGDETSERPPITGQWSYATRFRRVALTEFKPLEEPVSLPEAFGLREHELREYFRANQYRVPKALLFYVIQADRLQCLNGAYPSQVSSELLNILFGESAVQGEFPGRILDRVPTGDRRGEAVSRLGQREFSRQVRGNYESRCCFPGCEISEKHFLVGAHIARWSDKPAFRGDVSNGLCLCLMHDRAFELGFFTLDAELKIWVNPRKMPNQRWTQEHLLPFHGHSIRLGLVHPADDALLAHWERTGCYPNS